MTDLEQVLRDAQAALANHRDACSAFITSHSTLESIEELTVEQTYDVYILYLCTTAAARSIHYPNIERDYAGPAAMIRMLLSTKLALAYPDRGPSPDQIGALQREAILRHENTYVHMRPPSQYEQGAGAVN